jgi:hypothetical protein
VAIRATRSLGAESREESTAEVNLDLHQFGDGATGLCLYGDRLERGLVDARYLPSGGRSTRRKA